MNTVLKLSQSIQSAKNPYMFQETALKVYTHEEFLYHLFFHYKSSLEEFNNGSFVFWLENELRLEGIATQFEKIRISKETPAEKYISFLTITDYFDKEDIAELTKKLAAWGKQPVWEKLKEKGDLFLNKGEPEKAETYYIQVLKLSDEPTVFNNLGIAFMQQEKYVEAEINFQEALLRDGENLSIIYNTIELYILLNRLTYAEKLLDKAKELDRNNVKNLYYESILENKRGRKNQAIDLLKEAINVSTGTNAQAEYYLKLTDIYISSKRYEEAQNIVANYPNKKHEAYFLKLAQIHQENGNLQQARQSIEQGLLVNQNSVKLWLELAKVYASYDIQNASKAATHALTLAPTDIEVLFENAKIKKELGRVKEYQQVLSEILSSWKDTYRLKD